MAPGPARTASLAALLVLALLAGLSIGAHRGVGLREALGFVAGRPLPPGVEAVLELRLSRTLAAALVGAALAAGGAGLQVVLRNPLADPYLLGISSGAALAVVAAYAAGARWLGALQAAALAGGLAAFAATAALAAAAGGGRLSLIVAGVAVGYMAWSGTVILLYRLGPEAGWGLYWLYGTVAYTTPEDLARAAPLALAGVAVLAVRARGLDRLILGDEVAESMGVRVARLRLEVVVAAGLATAASVAIAGPVGFVGLAGAWAGRAAAGSLFTRLLPASLAAGAALVVAADVAARLAGPGELPLTALTTRAGVPVIVYVMARMRGE